MSALWWLIVDLTMWFSKKFDGKNYNRITLSDLVNDPKARIEYVKRQKEEKEEDEARAHLFIDISMDYARTLNQIQTHKEDLEPDKQCQGCGAFGKGHRCFYCKRPEWITSGSLDTAKIIRLSSAPLNVGTPPYLSIPHYRLTP